MKLLRPAKAFLPVLALLLLLPAGTGAAPAESPAPGRIRSRDPRAADDPGSPSASPSAAKERGSAGAFSRADAGALDRAPGMPIGNSNILHRQALKRLIGGDVAGALANFDFAIRISPDDASLYTDRGLARQRGEDPKGALADWNRAIELDPKNVAAYSNRGNVRLEQGDTAGGNADLLQAVKLDPRSESAFLQLANAENIQRDFMNAWADYRSACDHAEHPPDYEQLAICLIRTRIGEGPAAGKRLAEYFQENGRTAANEWTSQIADYLLRKLPEADLLAAAAPEADAAGARRSTGRLCEAWYYVGMKKLLTQDKEGAAKAFRECLATGQKWYVEYRFAETELKGLPTGG